MKDRPGNDIPYMEYRKIRKFLYESIGPIDRRRTTGRPHEEEVILCIYKFMTETRTCKKIECVKYIQPNEKQIYTLSAFLHGISFELIATVLNLPINHVRMFYSVAIENIAGQMAQQSVTHVSE